MATLAISSLQTHHLNQAYNKSEVKDIPLAVAPCNPSLLEPGENLGFSPMVTSPTTNSSPLKIGRAPKRTFHLPTINFLEPCWFSVGGGVVHYFLGSFVNPSLKKILRLILMINNKKIELILEKNSEQTHFLFL